METYLKFLFQKTNLIDLSCKFLGIGTMFHHKLCCQINETLYKPFIIVAKWWESIFVPAKVLINFRNILLSFSCRISTAGFPFWSIGFYIIYNLTQWGNFSFEGAFVFSKKLYFDDLFMTNSHSDSMKIYEIVREIARLEK